MDKSDVYSLLEENRNQRGIDNWAASDRKLDSYGIGLTLLRKLARRIGRDAPLASELWNGNNYDAKIISLLIDDPKLMSREQVERQVDELEEGYLVHVFSSCNATLGKTSFVRDLIDDWIPSQDAIRCRCGYGLLYDLSKSKKKDAPGNEYFLNYLRVIEDSYEGAERLVLLAMGGALQGIGLRNLTLYREALRLAEIIGPIDFNEEGQHCDPLDVVKNLTSDSVLKKFGL